jgi:5-methylcytosine-specific restriction endonuclease McrA
MNPCHRTFDTSEQTATCPDCHHAVIAHIGTKSCVICRMEYTLTPEWRHREARIHGWNRPRPLGPI